MKNYISIAEDIKEVIGFINDKNLNENQDEINKMIDVKLLDILKNCYILVRTIPEEVPTVINILNELIKYVLDKKDIRGAVLARIGSFISLKNDIQLQQELKKEYIDIYLSEAKALIDINKYRNKCCTISKVLEMVAKIQFANNILNIEDVYVLDLYKKLIIEMLDANEFQYFFDLPTYPEHHTLPTLFSYYLLYNKDKTIGYGYDICLSQILFEWKYFKFKHYNTPKDEIDVELKNDSEYNFIYKKV